MSSAAACIFCNIQSQKKKKKKKKNNTTEILHTDEKVVAFQDMNPSAFKHYLVNRQGPSAEDSRLFFGHMLDAGQMLLTRDAPNSAHYRFGFHQSPFNSVNHLHLHCLALPFSPRWKRVKYSSLGPLGGFIQAQKLLERLKP